LSFREALDHLFRCPGACIVVRLRSLMKAALMLAVRQGWEQGRRVVVVGMRDELTAIGEAELLCRFGLTEVERVAFPNSGNCSLTADKDILASLD
jgi:hypothetical protein